MTAACGDDESTETPPVDSKKEVLDLLSTPCEDDQASIYDAAPDGERGALKGCRYDRRVDIAEMEALYDANGDPQPGLSTAVHKLSVSFVTERGPGESQLTSAAVFVPEKRRTDGGSQMPVVVLGHGSVGTADICAPSMEHPDGFETGWKALVYAYAGDGWTVVMPDFPGLGTEGTTTWMHSVDEGHALLDATRAARELFADGVLSSRNAIIGHSNGGHAALSAQSYASDYGTAGTLELVIAHNPFWLSNAAWGALVSPAGVALIDPVFMGMTMMYFVGHLAAYEGEDKKLDAFLPEKRDEAGAMLESGCWQVVTREAGGPPSIGANVGADLYLDEYVNDVGICAVNPMSCTSPLASSWNQRWAADRPPPDPSVPIIHWTGAQDDFVTPDFQQCGIERIEAQNGALSVCIEQSSNHGSILANSAGWVRAKLAEVLLDESAPAACDGIDTLPMPPTCNLPIPNSTDPADP